MTHEDERQEREEREHASNIGLLVLALAGHGVGDFGDCSINDPITTIVDFERPAHELLQALATMSRETAAGLARQCGTPRDMRRGPMTAKSKAKLLAHYEDKEPKVFRQFDGWLNSDNVVGCDDDGHGLTAGTTWELMSGADVRVLIPIGTTAQQAVTLLRKIIGWIESGGLDEINQRRQRDERNRARVRRAQAVARTASAL